jgi:hypothetical protein
MGRACSTHGADRHAYRILVRNPEGERPLGRPRSIGWIVIKWILREVGWGGIDWIDLAQNRNQWSALVNTVKYFRVP